MPLHPELLARLACPTCKKALEYEPTSETVRCTSCELTFAIHRGIPVLIECKALERATMTNAEPLHAHAAPDAATDRTPATPAAMPFDYLTHYETDAEHFDYFEERTGATAHSERRLRENILSMLPKNANAILDVGCGSAWLAKAIRPSGRFLCSLDVSLVNTDKAVDTYLWKDHVAVVADTFALPFRDNAFDAIVAAEIIEHLPDPRAFVRELMRVVRPGGTVLISTPYKEKLKYEVCIHCNHPTPHNAHLHSFDEEKLRALFPSSATFEWTAFNNKLLLFARTYPVLRYFPFRAWLAIDKIANTLLRAPVNIIVKACKG